MKFLYGTALFLAAFLLFCSQPMVSKMMLPLLGGSAAVWTTAVLFFQVALLAGYLYVDRLARIENPDVQASIHFLLMGTAFVFLPMQFAGHEAPIRFPVFWELLQLSQTVGVPYLMISTTAPLLQRWFSRSQDPAARDPYFLYAASNAGSLLGLLAYPFIIEPRLGVRAQSVWWTWGYAGLVLFVVLAALIVRKAPVHSTEETVPAASLDWKICFYWMAAAFVPSGLFLAVTTHISVNLTMPLVWTIPLAIYLLTFILAFARRLRISSATLAGAVPPLLVLLCPVVGLRVPVGFSVDVFLMAVHMVLLFLAALLCHTALADARPDPAHLTRYYVWIALGGALGGVFAAIVAPVLFKTILEYPLLLAAAMFFRKPARGTLRYRWLTATGLAALVLGYAFFLPGYLAEPGTTIHVARNFFGVKKVMEIDAKTRKLLHGDTMHGLESRESHLAGQPVAYYHSEGPLGDAMRMLDGRSSQRVAVVGLGAGSIAAYASPERRVTFFEIDPQVETIARRFFTFLDRCGRNCDVHLGDGRLLMTRFPEREFDLIVLDAFSSDAIPPHLLSREAMDVYLSRLKPGGAILFHVSNRYLKVKELVSTLVLDMNLTAYVRVDEAEDKPLKNRSVYVIAADLPMPSRWRPVTRTPGLKSWSDDYSNLIDLVKWGTDSQLSP